MLHPHLASALLLAVAGCPGPSRGVGPLLTAPSRAADPSSGDPAGRGAADPTLASGSLRIDRGEQSVPIWVPPGEELRYDVRVDIGILGSVGVGKVTLSAGIEDYRPGLPLPGTAPARGGEKAAWLRSYAEGGHLGYHLQHELLARILPQDWPRIVFRDTQKGSENRRRELKIGEREGALMSAYRHDGHCGGCGRREHFVSSALPWGSAHHCRRCRRGEHRTWREEVERGVPEGAVDMLSAVYLARTFLREDWSETSFPLMDKDRLWRVGLSRGGLREIETAAGTFQCVEILMRTELPPDEPDDGEDFSGLFGIKGDLHIWMESETGVPVLIQGELPVADIMMLGVDVRLEHHRGTPPAFRPLGQR